MRRAAAPGAPPAAAERPDETASETRRLRSSARRAGDVGTAAALVLNAFNSNLRVLLHADAGRARARRRWRRTFRVGGLVQAAALQRDGLTVSFVVTDTAQEHARALRRHPSRPVQGRQGRGGAGPAGADGVFHAREVLAKHDENYMPPEAADAISRRKMSEARTRRRPAAERGGQPMIPELGHFALILALLLALAARRRCRWPARTRAGATGCALARPAAQPAVRLFVAFAFACLADAFVDNDFSVLYVATQFELAAAAASIASPRSGAATKARCCSWMLMLAAGRSPSPLSAATCRNAMVARVLGVLGLVARRLPALHAVHLEPVRARCSRRAADGRDLNPLLQDPGMVVPPADALHGLRRLLGRLRVRHRRADRRPARCGVGALVAALDHASRGCS